MIPGSCLGFRPFVEDPAAQDLEVLRREAQESHRQASFLFRDGRVKQRAPLGVPGSTKQPIHLLKFSFSRCWFLEGIDFTTGPIFVVFQGA